MRTASVFLIVVTSCIFASAASAQTTITVGGTIYQPNANPPATNNPSLDNVMAGDVYSVTLNFTGSITGPVLDFTNFTSADFADLTHPVADESSFISQSLTITSSGGMDTFNDLVCLSNPYLGKNRWTCLRTTDSPIFKAL